MVKYSDEKLITDLRRVSRISGTKKISAKTYQKYGKYSNLTIRMRLGPSTLLWEEAADVAGLSYTVQRSPIPREMLKADLRRVADIIKKQNISAKEYKAHGKYSYEIYVNHFGSWSNALESVGLQTSKEETNHYISDEELLDDLCRVSKLCKHKNITREEYEQYGNYTWRTYYRRFGNWGKSLTLAGLKKERGK